MNNSQSKVDELLPQLHLYAEKDADKFETIRQKIIHSAISSFPPQYRKRALGIQFQLDHELDKCKDPATRMNRMIELFWEKVNELNVALNNPEALLEAREENRKPAKVIPLFK